MIHQSIMTLTRAIHVLGMSVDVSTVPAERLDMFTSDNVSSELQYNQQNKVYQSYKHGC